MLHPYADRIGGRVFVRRFLVFCSAGLLLLAGLWYADTHMVPSVVPTVTPAPLATRTPEPTPTVAAQTGPQAVVISLGGAGADRVRAYMAMGTMPALAGLKAQGAMAEYALSVDPSLSAPAQASMATGAYPVATGVVSDRYHIASDEFGVAVDALTRPPAGAEPVWRTAMREARRTAAVCWPGTSIDAPETLADYTVTCGTVDAPSAQHEVSLGPAEPWAGAPHSFSPLREGTLTITKNGVPLATVHVLAADTTDNGQADYDTCILSRRREVGDKSAAVRQGDSAPLVIDENLTSGAYFTLTQAGADMATIYQGPVCYNRAQPNELVREVNARFGFFPAGPDDGALEAGWITPEQYVEAAATQSQWILTVGRFVLETYKPEVFFTYQGVVDALQHRFLLQDAGQPGYSAELAARYDGYVRRGYELADAAVDGLAKDLDFTQTTLLVVSDHGVAPVHSQIYANTILGAEGLLAYASGSGPAIDAARTRAVAVAAGGAAHVYINLSGREQAGIVSEDDYKATQDAIVAALARVRDAAGNPVFGRVLRREELAELELGAAGAGDVFVQAAPGYVVSDGRGGDILAPATYYGGHGHVATLPEMHAMFLAVGRGIRTGISVGPVHIVDLAPTVDRLLGLKPPEPRAGRVLEEVLLP